MSFDINKKEKIISYIVDKNNKIENTVSLVDSKNGNDFIELDSDHHFQLAPRPLKETERMCIFVSGESGAGKSYYIREYSKFYNKMFKNNEIYLISYLKNDETLDEFKKIIRLDVIDNIEFLENIEKLNCEEEFSNCLVIFDDIDSISNKRTKDKIYSLLNKLLRIGRHFSCSICYASHELYNDPTLKHILNECQIITFFPKYLNYKKIKYLLETYFGLSKNQIEKIKSIDSRFITYFKGNPKVIMSEKIMFLLKDS
jgi:Cdc6-like AAA superfamily ATPase